MIAVNASQGSAGCQPSIRTVVKTRRASGTISRKQPSTWGLNSPAPSRIRVSNPPPGRRSSLITLHSMGSGIHHFARCSGVLHAFQTTAGGALIKRAMVRSDSLVAIFNAPGHLRFDIVGKPIRSGLPKRTLLGEPGLGRRQPLGLHPAGAAPARPEARR